MHDTATVRHGVPTLLCAEDGTRLRTHQDAVDLVALAVQHGVQLLILPTARLDEGFFSLSSGIAGEILQTFANYRLRLAIVGDLTRHLNESSSLQALIHESNQGRQVWFVSDLEQLDARLERAQPR